MKKLSYILVLVITLTFSIYFTGCSNSTIQETKVNNETVSESTIVEENTHETEDEDDIFDSLTSILGFMKYYSLPEGSNPWTDINNDNIISIINYWEFEGSSSEEFPIEPFKMVIQSFSEVNEVTACEVFIISDNPSSYAMHFYSTVDFTNSTFTIYVDDSISPVYMSLIFTLSEDLKTMEFNSAEVHHGYSNNPGLAESPSEAEEILCKALSGMTFKRHSSEFIFEHNN